MSRIPNTPYTIPLITYALIPILFIHPLICTTPIQIPVSRRRGSESEGGGSAEKQGLGVSKNKSRSKTTSSVVKASAMQRKTEGNSSGGMLAATAASSSDGICSNDDGYSAIELRARMRRAGSLGTWNLHEVQVMYTILHQSTHLCPVIDLWRLLSAY